MNILDLKGQNDNKGNRRVKVETLRSQLLVTRIFAISVTVLCFALGFGYMHNNNQLQDEKIATVLDYESQLQEMEKSYNLLETNYEYLVEKYDSFNNTINELTYVAQELDEQNKQLVESNQTYYDKIVEYEGREELFNKYEYAIISQGERTDITYDQLSTLEDLVDNSSINDEDLILSWIMTESGGKEKARNTSSTAKGYGQFLDGTSKFVYTKLLGKTDWTSSVALDGETNLEMMVAYIDYLYEINDGDLYEVIRDYRGKQDISGYVAKIDTYLENAGKSVEEIQDTLENQTT